MTPNPSSEETQQSTCPINHTRLLQTSTTDMLRGSPSARRTTFYNPGNCSRGGSSSSVGDSLLWTVSFGREPALLACQLASRPSSIRKGLGWSSTSSGIQQALTPHLEAVILQLTHPQSDLINLETTREGRPSVPGRFTLEVNSQRHSLSDHQRMYHKKSPTRAKARETYSFLGLGILPQSLSVTEHTVIKAPLKRSHSSQSGQVGVSDVDMSFL